MTPATTSNQSETFVGWPKSWRTAPLWSLFERIKDVGHPDEEMLSVYRNLGVVQKDGRNDNFNKTAENRGIYQLVDQDWLIINRMKAWQGSVGISPYRGIVSGHYICFRPRHGEHSRFLNWLLRSHIYALEYARLSRGVRPNQIEIDNDDLRTLPIRLPKIDEQQRIANFLDAETARVDKLADLQREALARLEERDSALLDAAIDELLKNSGSLPFRRYIDGMDQGSSPQCDAIPAGQDEWGVLKVSCLRPGYFHSEENKRLPGGIIPDPRYEIKEGDLLVTRANTPQLVGSTAVVPAVRRRLLLSDKIFRVRVSHAIDPRYVALIARGSRVRSLCGATSNGASQSMANVRFEEIKAWPIPPINIDEQRQLITRMDRETLITRTLRIRIGKQLALLAERRQL